MLMFDVEVSIEYVLIIIWFLFSKVMRSHGGGSGSSSSTKPIEERMQEFILSKIARSILEQTLVIFGTIKEGIMELLDERLGNCRDCDWSDRGT